MSNLDIEKYNKSNLSTKKDMLKTFYNHLINDELKITPEQERKNSKMMYYHLVNCTIELVRDDMNLADVACFMRNAITENKIGILAHYSDSLFSVLDHQIYRSDIKPQSQERFDFYPDIDFKKLVADFSDKNSYEKKENIEFYAWLGTYGRGYLGLERNHTENLESLKNKFQQSPDFFKIGQIYENYKTDLSKYQNDVYNSFITRLNRENPNNKNDNDFAAFVLTYHYDKLSLQNPNYMRPDALAKRIPDNKFSELHRLYGQFKKEQGNDLTNRTVKF